MKDYVKLLLEQHIEKMTFLKDQACTADNVSLAMNALLNLYGELNKAQLTLLTKELTADVVQQNV